MGAAGCAGKECRMKKIESADFGKWIGTQIFPDLDKLKPLPPIR
jgi:hypothetical protein